MALPSRLLQSILGAGRRPFIPIIPVALLTLLFFVWSVRIWLPQPFPLIGASRPPVPPPDPNAHLPKAPVSSLAKGDMSAPDALFIGWPLKRVCEEMDPIEGLVYVCDNNSGGIGNIRNYLQTCIRYGLEAGMSGLVMPLIRKRSDNDLANLFTDYLPFSYMFDEDHFKEAFAENCPRITIYDAIDQVHGYDGNDKTIDQITPRDMTPRDGCDNRDQNRHTDRWNHTFRKWLTESAKDKWYPSMDRPRLVRFTWGVLFDWQIYRDGPEFAATFGSILRPQADLLALGQKTKKAMHKFAMESGTQDGGYLGFHLRSESDALTFWPTYDTQSKGYVEQARKRPHLKAAYLATGNASEARKLEAMAEKEVGVKVVSKLDLLKDQDLEQLNKLTWDQQAIIDYVVLLGREFFVGVNPSSFSIILAMRRHLRTNGVNTRPWKVGAGEGDGLSYVVGRYEKYWDDWLYMWDGMWP